MNTTKRRTPLLLAGAAVLGLTAMAVYAAAGQSGPDEVERIVHLHGLAVPAWGPEEIYIATHQGLARIDSKGRWSFVSKLPHDFMGFQANHTEEGVLYSSGHPAPGSNFPNPVGIMVSRDAGETWELLSLAGHVDFHAMTVQSTDGDVIYGYSGGLMRSLDGGESWERIEGDPGRIGNVYALAVHPGDADVLWAASSSGLWRSEDGGKSWVNAGPQVPVTAVTYAGGRLWAYVVSPAAGLVASDDDGESWLSTGFFLEGNDAIAYIAPRPDDRQQVYVGSFGQSLYVTTDGGKNWQPLAVAGVPVSQQN